MRHSVSMEMLELNENVNNESKPTVITSKQEEREICLFTMAFQILTSASPITKLTMEPTLRHIRTNLHCEDG
ncbi:hypothetical protein MTR_2g101730 [Medicago truncatula]|uniref:Uncharacterized protein n=1 Tax=Medicago truncatula TaxID=3880 RepID=G7IUR4_MEDTR|nr:hypothetical protein MTR_2g101730 [Medicago truncatula]